MTGGAAGAGAARARVACATETGLVRKRNEDRLAVGDLDARELLPDGELGERELGERGLLLVVCDGMGGAEGGDIASQLAVEGLWAAMRDAAPTRDVAIFARHLRRAVRAANQLVFREAHRLGLRGMGTTLSAAGMAGSTLVVAQVGDSRVYVERGGVLSQITRDQSVVSALVSAGRMTDEEAARSLQRSAILQALGVRDDVDVSLSIADLRRGDRILVCSDGLHGVVGDAEIERVVAGARADDLDEVLGELVELATRAGGPDNISAILVEVEGDGLEPPGAACAVSFAELDPFTEGEGALSETSRVARRLAARAGLREDAPDADILATRQQPAPSRAQLAGEGRGAPGRAPPPGPATEALAARSRIGAAPWIAAAIALALLALFVWRMP